MQIDGRLRNVEQATAELRGRVSQLPTTMQVFTYMRGLLGFAVALLGVAVAFVRLFIGCLL